MNADQTEQEGKFFNLHACEKGTRKKKGGKKPFFLKRVTGQSG